MSVPFVGREEERRALGTLISGARRAGVPTTALVTGEPGSGKSRLLREVLRDADPHRTVRVAGFEPTESIPFAAVGDLVRRLARVPGHGPRLEALVFGSADRRGRSPLPVFEATHRALAGFGPLLLAVDDLQWIDVQSMALLHYVVRAAESARQPLVVIAASRPSAAAATFTKGIEGALPASRRPAFELRGLSKAAGITLLRALDRDLDEAGAEELWRRAAGSPFWLEALARERGAANARDLVADRLRALSADAGRLVSALAVVARPATREELAAVLEWRPVRLEHATREIVARGLASEAAGAIRLAHDLIREAAAESVPAAASRRLHARLAELIEASAGDDLTQLTEALDHRVAGGLEIAQLASRIVASPSRRMIGVDLLARLSSLADSLPTPSAEQASLDAGLGRLAAELAEHELAIRHWRRVATASREPRDRQLAALAAARAAYILRRGSDVHAFIDQARSMPADTTTAILLDAFEADVAMWLDHDTARGARLAQRATSWQDPSRLGRGAGEAEVALRTALVAAYDAAADAAMQLDRGEDVIRLSDTALALTEGLGEEAHLEALLRAGMTRRAFGYVHEAELRWRAGRVDADRLILPVASVEAGIGLARVLRDQGRLDEALVVARDTAQLEARIGSAPQRWGTAHAVLLSVELSRGEPGALARLREEAPTYDSHFGIGAHQMVATWLARHDGRPRSAEVAREIESARAASAKTGCRRCARELAVVSAELLARIGDVREARRELDDWEAELSEHGYVMRDLWQARARAAIAVATGAPDSARLLANLAEAFEAAAFLEDAAWAWVDRGRVLTAEGDRSGAVAAFTRAAALADRGGALGVGRLAAKALRDLGIRAWRRTPVRDHQVEPRDVLSRREWEVARLVAGGESNREIADALSLSPKTVERHVTNILAKVGARNRTELATVIHERSNPKSA